MEYNIESHFNEREDGSLYFDYLKIDETRITNIVELFYIKEKLSNIHTREDGVIVENNSLKGKLDDMMVIETDEQGISRKGDNFDSFYSYLDFTINNYESNKSLIFDFERAQATARVKLELKKSLKPGKEAEYMFDFPF